MRAPFLIVIWLGACASSSAPEVRELYDPGPLTEMQKRQLIKAEKLYRADDAEYPVLFDELVGNPTTAFWFTRMFVRDILWALDQRAADETQMMAAAAGWRHPVEVKAREQIQQLGGAAMPCLVEDLLKSSFPDRREIGIDLIAAVGTPAVPALLPVLDDPEPRYRRAAAKALGVLPSSTESLQALERAATDAEFTVRADAVRGLAGGGPAQAELLRRILGEDADHFVREVAAKTLGGYPDVITAETLIDYLERCRREHDAGGEQAAQASLRGFAGGGGPRTVAAWRQWLSTWQPSGG